MKKNINTALQNTWLSTAYLIILSFVLLASQLGFAKDRIQYHVQNFDGSTLKVINEQGVVSQSYQYAPFGQQLQLKKPSNLKNPRAFVGGVQDANDLVYLKQRHYNPVLGRFYQPDPVTFISGGHGQTNRYQYGWNDTYTFSDPSGLATKNGVSDTQFEQFMYDWWPGYKLGTGIYNSFEEGSNQFNFWEGVDVLSVFGGVGAKSLQFADNVALTFSSKFSFISSTRPLGSKLEYVDDVFSNPALLKTIKSPDQFKSMVHIDNNYLEGVMKRTRSLDKGFTLRELAPDGKNVTDRYIQYHPGSVRHYDGQPYWKISSGKNGTVRFPVE